jgi:hypothetical protein
LTSSCRQFNEHILSVLDVLAMGTGRASSASSRQWLEHGEAWDVPVLCIASRVW